MVFLSIFPQRWDKTTTQPTTISSRLLTVSFLIGSYISLEKGTVSLNTPKEREEITGFAKTFTILWGKLTKKTGL